MEHEEQIIPVGNVDWGSLKRFEPIGKKWGFERGNPVDRYYIEMFLERHANKIGGCCLELLKDQYTSRYGGSRVSQLDILHINSENIRATVTGDLASPDTLKNKKYNCIILTQALHLIYDCKSAVKNLCNALEPGGTILITVPSIAGYFPDPCDNWRFTVESLGNLLQETVQDAEIEIMSYGNLLTSIGFLMGLSSHEFSKKELDHEDRRYAVTIAGCLTKKKVS